MLFCRLGEAPTKHNTFVVVTFINLAILHLQEVANRSASIEMQRGKIMMSTTPIDLQIPRKAKSAFL